MCCTPHRSAVGGRRKGREVNDAESCGKRKRVRGIYVESLETESEEKV